MRELKPILEEHINSDTLFVDAFTGGANVVCEIDTPNKLAMDIDPYIIDLWHHIQREGMDGIPQILRQSEYEDIRLSEQNHDGRYPDWLIGYVSTACSYGGGVWKGYAKFNQKKNEDHILEAYNGLRKQVEEFLYLKDTQFVNCSYDERVFSKNVPCVIYCDPPYADTVRYRSDFDHRTFWEWVRKMSRDGHYVYVSEYNAPDDFECVWEKKKPDGMSTSKKGKKQNLKTEKLFIYKNNEY